MQLYANRCADDALEESSKLSRSIDVGGDNQELEAPIDISVMNGKCLHNRYTTVHF